MIPILFQNTETTFTSNGLGRLSDCVRCVVTEERNGIYELEFDYPVTGANFESIQVGCIVLATHDEAGDGQPFDIVSKSEPIDGIVTFHGQHVSYRANGLTVKPFTATTCAQAFLVLPNYIIGDNPFTFTTNKDVTADLKVTEPRGLRGLLAGEEGSILDVYGPGEYTFNRWNIDLSLHRGQDTDVSIVYGKNLVDFENEVDASEVYTAVVPFWTGTDDEGAEILVTLPEWYISSGHTVPAGREIIVPMDLSDEFDEQPTEAQLRDKATSRLANSDAWVPSQTIDIDFVQLWQTEEYKQFAPLQRLKLCDTCVVEVPMYDIKVRAKVIRTVWNVLLDRYDSMELGDKPSSYASLVASDAAKEAAAYTDEKAARTKTEVEQAMEKQADLIRGALGGYIVQKTNADGQPIEQLITDNLDLTQALNIWRWNIGGLAHSSNGYNGPYNIAITQDGKISADFILAGTMLADRIHGGTLTLGGMNNASGVLQVLDQNGVQVGRWDKDGATIVGNLKIDYNDVAMNVGSMTIRDFNKYSYPVQTYDGMVMDLDVAGQVGWLKQDWGSSSAVMQYIKADQNPYVMAVGFPDDGAYSCATNVRYSNSDIIIENGHSIPGQAPQGNEWGFKGFIGTEWAGVSGGQASSGTYYYMELDGQFDDKFYVQLDRNGSTLFYFEVSAAGLKLGNTRMTEAQLQQLLALI